MNLNSVDSNFFYKKISIDNLGYFKSLPNEALNYAYFNGHVQVVKLLLADPRVDPSANNNEAIRMASEKGQAGECGYFSLKK